MIGAATQNDGTGLIIVIACTGIAVCFVWCLKVANDAKAWTVRPWESHRQTVIRRQR